MENQDLARRFQCEVLANGSTSTLPKNLSDEWLNILLNQGEDIINEQQNSRMTELLSAVLNIVIAKNGGTEVSMEMSEIVNYIYEYTMELSSEEINRQTDVKIIPATLETIFTNRKMELLNNPITN